MTKVPKFLKSQANHQNSLPWLIVIFGLILQGTFNQVHSSKQTPSMQPSDPFAFVGDEISLCCLHLYPSGMMVDAGNVSFHCVDGTFKLDKTYISTQQENKICVNITALVPVKKSGWCECEYFSKSASQYLRVDNRPVADEDFSCIFHIGKHFNCAWSPQEFAFPENVKISLLYRPLGGCSLSEKEVSCSPEPPCEIFELNTFCFMYSVALKTTYTTPSQKLVVSQTAWKEFNLSSINKLSPLEVDFKRSNETCITLFWNRISHHEIIQFNFTSQWEPERVEKSIEIETNDDILNNPFSLDNGNHEREFCQFTPHTVYTITVTIRPNMSDLWSDPYTLNGSTTEDVPSRSPPTVSGAFKRTSEKSAILYWKGLSAKEWQSNQERIFHLFLWNYSSHSWWLNKTVNWRTYQTEISLVDEKDTLVKLQAYNNVGYAKDYSQLVLSSKGERFSPANVTAVIHRNSAKVTVSWDALFNDVIIFWCLWKDDYHCLNDPIDWQELKDVSKKSVTLEIPSLNPASNYMFGVSVLHSNVSTGITWTTCTSTVEGQKVHKSNCTNPQTKVNKAEEWKEILPPAIAVPLGIAIIFLIVCWYTKRWRKHTKTFGLPAQNLVDIPYTYNDQTMDKGDPSFEVPQIYENQVDLFDEDEDSEMAHYGRVGGLQSSSIILNEEKRSKPKTKVVGHSSNTDEMDSGDAPHYWSGNCHVTDEMDSGDAPHCGTANSHVTDEMDSGDAPHCETANSHVTDEMNSEDAPHCGTGNSLVTDEMDSGDAPHYGTGNSHVTDDIDSGDAPHCETANSHVTDEMNSEDAPHCGTGNSLVTDEMDSGDAPHYGTGNSHVTDEMNSGDAPHYWTGNSHVTDEMNSGDAPHYGTGNFSTTDEKGNGEVSFEAYENSDLSDDKDSGESFDENTTNSAHDPVIDQSLGGDKDSGHGSCSSSGNSDEGKDEDYDKRK